MAGLKKLEQYVELAKKHGIIKMRYRDDKCEIEFAFTHAPVFEKLNEKVQDPKDVRRQQLLMELHSSDLTPEEIERML